MNVISFTKVRLAHGWLGNMSAHIISFSNLLWKTSEALFQAGRFNSNDPIVEEIRLQASPMGAKLLAKKHVDKMIIVPQSDADLEWMEQVLRMKIEQHSELKKLLMDTGDATIIEDCTSRQRGSGLFWGAAKQVEGSWVGDNQLGKLWMKIRGT